MPDADTSTPSVTDAPSENRAAPASNDAAPPALGGLVTRSALGGVLMGLANLVPGISGGTMLLAAGVYPRFIAAIGEVTTFKFRRSSVVVLGTVVAAALLAIVLLAGMVKDLVVGYRWAMYSVFIGLTLGGVPVVWRLIRQAQREPATASTGPGSQNPARSGGAAVWTGALLGFAGMAALAVLQSSATGGASGGNEGFAFMLLAGVAGAAAMILPGVSGGYLLLVLGVYVPILAGIDAFKDALSARDTAALIDVGLKVVLPVGLGVLVGVVGVSNLLRWLLKRYELATLGVLLGLLLGAVVGLWPFQQSVEPEIGDTVRGRAIKDAPVVLPSGMSDSSNLYMLVYADTDEVVEREDWPTEFFTPDATQVAGSVGLILLGFGVTMGVDRLGREKPDEPRP